MGIILLLEDDTTLNDTITEFLQERNYEVTAVYDGDEAQDKIYENRYDLLILDVNVPGVNGFELLQNERKKGNETPAIYITSMDSVDDVEKGFLSGANDYIRKPFSLKELLLRIENILKQKPNENIEVYEDCVFTPSTNTLQVGKERYILQNKESLLLKLFLDNKEQIIHHETISSTLWVYNEKSSDQALRTYIKHLRKYLGKEKIVSYKKLGYKFTTE